MTSAGPTACAGTVPAPDPVFLATAVEIVLRAGEIQMAGRESGFRVAKKGDIDLVTEVDLACERMCRAVLAERFPDHDILAEELSSGPGEAARARYRWVFDPVDGTTNYAHGLPIFCASLALELDGRALVGAIYDPSRRELFTAEVGQGAFVNGAPLKTSLTPAIGDALLVTGFPYDMHVRGPELVELFGLFLHRARAVRRLGSAALDLCYVAAGRFDGFWEQHLKPWDVSAGALMVTESGGRITGMDGGDFSVRAGHLVASNGPVHEAMLEVIRDSPASRTLDRTH
ncbi:MAG TPA: inositol monophosphatase family protein [Vicinamibacterales bacterium]|nr:inositol monophosphatase family protein [Vicinamibacterales bacterium]